MKRKKTQKIATDYPDQSPKELNMLSQLYREPWLSSISSGMHLISILHLLMRFIIGKEVKNMMSIRKMKAIHKKYHTIEKIFEARLALASGVISKS